MAVLQGDAYILIHREDGLTAPNVDPSVLTLQVDQNSTRLKLQSPYAAPEFRLDLARPSVRVTSRLILGHPDRV